MDRNLPTSSTDFRREEWIAFFVEGSMRVSLDEDAADAQALAEACWERSSHRDAVNVVQDLLISRHLAAEDKLDAVRKP